MAELGQGKDAILGLRLEHGSVRVRLVEGYGRVRARLGCNIRVKVRAWFS